MARAYWASAAALATIGTVLGVASCSSKTESVPAADTGLSDVGTGDTSPGVATFAPKGCGYNVSLPKTPVIPEPPPLLPHEDLVTGEPNLRHVRVGLGGNVVAGAAGYADPSSSFAVGWQTDDGAHASRMKFGEAPDKLDQTADGFSFNVAQEFRSGPEAGIRFHEAHVCGLKAGRTYYYQVGGGPVGKETWSGVGSVTTAPAKDSSDPSIIGFTGDTRDKNGGTKLPVWQLLAGRLKNSGAKVALFSGDIILAGAIQDQWDTWLTVSDDAAKNMFFALAPGNHENENLRFFAHSLMPGSATANSERYASFDYGSIHVIMMDDYFGIVAKALDDTNYRAEVLSWLDADLTKANANRANVPWIVTFHHHPFYSSGSRTERVAERAAVREAFQNLYDKHRVTLDLAGHDHFYERSKPVKADKDDPTGTTFVVAAAGGAPSYGTEAGINRFSTKIESYDPEVLQGIYGLMSGTKAELSVKMYKMAGGGGGTSPADDKIVDEFKFTK